MNYDASPFVFDLPEAPLDAAEVGAAIDEPLEPDWQLPEAGDGIQPGQPSARPPDILDDLVVRAVRQEPMAVSQLLAEIHPLVLRYCRGRLGRRQTADMSAEDVTQNVCLAVVDSLSYYQPSDKSFRSFVYAIAAHKVVDVFRAAGRNPAVPTDCLPEQPSPMHGPEAHIEQQDLASQIGKLLLGLNPRQREILTLRFLCQLSTEETAQQIGSTPGAVRVSQHRALNRLRGLAGGGFGPELADA